MQYGRSTKYLSIWMAALATGISADQITLINGDIIQGQLGEQTDSHVIWNSDSFGSLSIALEQVATINGEPLNTQPLKAVSNGGLSFAGGHSDGNQEREDWDFSSYLEWREGALRHSSNLNYETHSLNDSLSKREYAIGYSLDWFFQEQWYWSNSVAFGANEERAIDQYYSVGSAMGRQFWDTELTALSAETGLLWISEDLEDQTSDRRLTWSWAADYRIQVRENVEFFHSHQIFIALTDLKDSDLKADIGLKVPVVENLFTELKMEWIYDNQPAVDTKKSDSQFTIGVNYSW